MFTGLIEAQGRITRLAPRGPGVQIGVHAGQAFVESLTVGDSVACDGACLTVVTTQGQDFTVDASSETMNRTTLSMRRVGDPLHLERALALGDRLGGHLVTGHVDTTGILRSTRRIGETLHMSFAAPEPIRRYLIPKGSITIDGVSLTVNGVDQHGFDIVLIPHTQSVVHLHGKQAGSLVNLEADLIGKYVEHLLEQPERSAPVSRVNMALLKNAGFIS